MFRRTILAVLLALCAVVLAPAAAAMAEPTIEIRSPEPGSVTNERMPEITGSTTDSTDEVQVTIYREGSPLTTISAQPELFTGSWSVQTPVELEDGPYVVVADQTETSSDESASSEEVPFSVHADPPKVTLNAVSAPPKDSTPSFSGTASEDEPVTVYVFAAGDVGGHVYAEAHANGTGGSWSSGDASPALSDGAYTAVAEQESEYGDGPGYSGERTFTVHAAKPKVTLNAVSSPTKDSTPSFSGTASEETAVTVRVYAQGHVGGHVYAEAEAQGTGGSWSSGAASPSLADGTYTAVAEQESEYGDGPGYSGERTFTVHAAAPKVMLNAVSSPTEDSTPSFSGMASEETPVTVRVYAQGHVGGHVYAEAEAEGTAGSWSSDAASPSLADGTYTAVAEQESEYGDGPGYSEERTFTVETAPPTVTLETISSPTGDTTPSFSGTASATTGVTVDIYKGASAVGSPAATAHATGTGGSWSSGDASPALAEGSYTAVAIQKNSLGKEGFSEEIHFSVITAAPSVTLNPIESVSNDTTPSFSGYASEHTTVTVDVYAGSSAKGSPVTDAEASGTGGEWDSGTTGVLTEGTYTAVAEQTGAYDNGTSRSNEIHFSVVTASPKVTLNAIRSPYGETQPAFTGTASDTTAVTISIYPGTATSGQTAASAQATGTAGSFASGHASPALAPGEYTAVARQPSSLGNPEGVSNSITFVIDTSPPTVTLEQPATPSNDSTPTFSGGASETEPVEVKVSKAGSTVETLKATVVGGRWSVTSPKLEDGAYQVVATERSSLDNPSGSSPERTFTIDTKPPTVTLEQPAVVSNVTTPTFSGTASESEPVEVKVSKGGSPVETLTATVSGGTWSTTSPTLEDGTYKVLATERSSLGNLAGSSPERTFTINTKAPSVTLSGPPLRTNETKPSFSGTGEKEQVTVKVYKGSSASGTPAAELHAEVSGGSWQTAALSSALAEGTYTAIAREESSIKGNPAGESNADTFTVETKSPVVTIQGPASVSNGLTPTFSGTATDTTPVVVHVFRRGGAEVATAETTPTKNSWSVVSPALPSGDNQYTAYATQASYVGNPAGRSPEISFEVDTEAPSVTIEPVKTPSNNRVPSFSGAASDTTHVVVHVMEAGKEVASAEGTPSAGKWKAGTVSPELPAGEHSFTAYATQESSLKGNPAGKSAEVDFVVDTQPPTVTLNTNEFPTPSNNISPTFSGTASDTTSVKVVVSGAGKKYESAPVAVSGGNWSGASVSLPSVKATYTAVAVQQSSLGNAQGESKPSFQFVVDPGAPTVSMSPIGPEVGTSTPTFTGTASDTTPVTVAICRVASSSCEPEAGEWSARSTGGKSWTATLSTPLPDGEYQALASQRTLAGSLGASTRQVFAVDTTPPAVTLAAPVQGSTVSGATVDFDGAAGTAPHDEGKVTLQLYPGGSATGAPLQTVSVDAGGGSWSATLSSVSPGLYTARASQRDAAGNVGVSDATFTDSGPAPAAAGGPSASFTWSPADPHVGETVTLVSSSTDPESPITGYAWSMLGSPFKSGAQTDTTSFATAGDHQVQLQVTDGAGHTAVSSRLIAVGYQLMAPFPLVRIVTTRARGKVRLKLLSVQAPAGATVSVTCTGKGCPLRSQVLTVPTGGAKQAASVSLTFARFERSLPAGVVLQIRVSAPGRIGKYTRFSIRKGKLPVRSDACLSSTAPVAVPCPG